MNQKLPMKRNLPWLSLEDHQVALTDTLEMISTLALTSRGPSSVFTEIRYHGETIRGHEKATMCT